jgi:phenylpyruvate tautomerase PptA (4-oxalocrotonate tautomerase family)
VPNVTIEVRKRYTREQEVAIIDAVHAALATPPKKDDRYTLVDIDLFSGCSLEAENWGIRGGVPASEVELGFKVDV